MYTKRSLESSETPVLYGGHTVPKVELLMKTSECHVSRLFEVFLQINEFL